MQLFISTLLITIGALFILLAGVGLVRMPDLFLRMSVSTKAATLGVGCTLLGVSLYFGDFATFIRAGAIIVFLLLTAPVAAHLIGRAAYQDGVPLWEKTEFDDLRCHYSPSSNVGQSSTLVSDPALSRRSQQIPSHQNRT